MDKRTSDALEASIKHWQENVAAEKPSDVSLKGSDCALCRMFFNSERVDSCSGCPVRIRTGRSSCGSTPYESACYARDEWAESINSDWGNGVRITKEIDDAREVWRTAARAELDFLKSLRQPTAVTP